MPKPKDLAAKMGTVVFVKPKHRSTSTAGAPHSATSACLRSSAVVLAMLRRIWSGNAAMAC